MVGFLMIRLETRPLIKSNASTDLLWRPIYRTNFSLVRRCMAGTVCCASATARPTDLLAIVLAKTLQPSSVARKKHCGRVGIKWLRLGWLRSSSAADARFCLPYQQMLSGNHAFIDYWPPDPNSKGLRLAVKDNIDMKGVVTTAGSGFFLQTHKPAKKDARVPGDRAPAQGADSRQNKHERIRDLAVRHE